MVGMTATDDVYRSYLRGIRVCTYVAEKGDYILMNIYGLLWTTRTTVPVLQ